jgi:hypothetical protein
MNIFETLGRSQTLLVEGNRQLAAALMGGTRRALRQFAQSLAESMRNTPNDNPFL